MTLNAGSILNLTLNVALANNDSMILIENESDNAISGIFSTVMVSGSAVALSSSNTFTYNGLIYALSYNTNADGGSVANDLTLTVVPEPSTWAMLVGGIGMLIMCARRPKMA